MEVISVNVALPRTIQWRGIEVETGIFKSPVDGPVAVKKLNLAGDQQADLTVHGGPDKAIYGYASEHYPYWRKELPEMTFAWGNFGENLTTTGLLEDELYIGDLLKVGSAVLTVTQPRLPCYKLQIRFGRDDIIKRFLRARRSGFYLSVTEEGELAAGSKIELLRRDPQRVRVVDIMDLFLGHSDDADLRDRVMRVEALPETWKNDLLMRSKMRAAGSPK
jgi:MOSC domain-containing protein YiiM